MRQVDIPAICCFYSGEQRLFSLLFGRQRRQKARVSAAKTGLVAVFTAYYQRKQRPGGSCSSTRGSSVPHTSIVTAVTSACLSSAARRRRLPIRGRPRRTPLPTDAPNDHQVTEMHTIVDVLRALSGTGTDFFPANREMRRGQPAIRAGGGSCYESLSGDPNDGVWTRPLRTTRSGLRRLANPTPGTLRPRRQ
jgi:hypothetical protein